MGRILADCLPKLGDISLNVFGDFLPSFLLSFFCALLFLWSYSKVTMSARHPSLWDFCLAIYGQAAIEQSCLRLQDQNGANVNVLLWLCWLADRGIALDQQQLDLGLYKIATWHDDVVAPLRQLRRAIKQDYLYNQEVTEPAREAIKTAELAAEKVELDWLEELSNRWKVSSEGIPRAANLQLYLERLGLSQDCSNEALRVFQRSH